IIRYGINADLGRLGLWFNHCRRARVKGTHRMAKEKSKINVGAIEQESLDGQESGARSQWLAHILSMVSDVEANVIIVAIHHLIYSYRTSEMSANEWKDTLLFHLRDMTGGAPRKICKKEFVNTYNYVVRTMMELPRSQFDIITQACYEWLVLKNSDSFMCGIETT